MASKFLIANALAFIKHLTTSFTWFYLSLYLISAGFSGLEIGVLLSLLTLTALFASFPAGMLNDRFGTSKPLVFGFILITVFYAGLYLFTGYWELVLLFALGGLGLNITKVSINNILFKSDMGPNAGTLFGKLNMWEHFGVAAGFFAGGFMLMFMEFGAVFLLSAFVFAIISVCSLFVGEGRRDRFPVAQYRGEIFNREVLFFLAVLFLYTMHWGAEITSYAPFLKTVLSLNLFETGIYMSIPVIFLALSAYLTGKAADSGRSLKKMLVFGLLLSGATHALMTVPVLEFSFAMRILHEIGDAIVIVLSFVLISRIFSIERRGGTSGFVFNTMIMGQFAGAVVFGALGAGAGYAIPLVAAGVLEILAAFLALLFLKNR
ncbi:MFS transporter [Candidatus Micrarchaeota archaeon]|nr:MFS transporter [Candidatus Micrarchaeota archaeon]MBU1939920.1 MFS transporter [Candidatus Micrarchaeota archaeon]